MDLIDRYLAAVRRQLPRALQKDVVEELSDSLRSEEEEQQARLGRALTLDEQAGLLKERGHPWLMASRYLPQQQLIGAGLFPYYRQALTFVLFWVVLPIILFGGAITAVNSEHIGQIWGRVLASAWNAAIYSVGIVTIVFAVLEHHHVRITALDRWNPFSLPEPDKGRGVPRSESLFNLITSLTVLVWWIELVRLPNVLDLQGASISLSGEPIWSAIYWPFLATLVATIAVALVDVVKPWRSLLMTSVAIVTNLAQLVLVVALVRAGHWINVVDAQAAERVANLDRWANLSVLAALIVIGFVLIAETLGEIWKITKRGDGERRL